MRHNSPKPLLILYEPELLNFYCWSTTLPNTRNWGTGVWGIYFDKASHDEQVSGSRIPRIGIFYRSLVAGEYEQDYSARSRMYPPRGHSRSRPPTRSIRSFLLEVEARSPSSHDYDNGASTSKSREGDGRGSWEGPNSREAYKKVTNEGVCGEGLLRGEILVVDELVEERSWSWTSRKPETRINTCVILESASISRIVIKS
ncbi:hypothetical protein WN943_024921 [Citrus x changshan-huyou]